MKRKILLTIITIVLTFMFFSLNRAKDIIYQDESYISNEETTLSSDNHTITMLDFATYLSDKNEHYPLSDEFIEKYQQTTGGYITFAKQLGMIVDKQLHEPNQKWHFFDSWLMELINDPESSLTWDADARVRVYNNLLSPELLLWIYEASGVEPSKVRKAKEVAEIGKVSGTHSATLAKNMRAEVSWEDIISNMDLSIKKATSVSLLENIELTLGDLDYKLIANPSPSYTTDVAVWTILEGSEYLSINQNGNEVSLKALKSGTAKIRVTYNEFIFAETLITIKEPDQTTIIGIPNVVDLSVGREISLTPTLTIGGNDFTYRSNDNQIATVSSSGVIVALANGSTTITITSIDNQEIEKTINVEVFNHGSEDYPLSVQEVLELKGRLNQDDDSFNTEMIFVQGKALDNALTNGSFNIVDFSKNQAVIKVLNSNNEINIPQVYQNDEVIIKGFLKFEDDNIKFSEKAGDEVIVLKNARGESTITLGEDSNTTIEVIGFDFHDFINVTNGETVYFTVNVPEDFIITKILVNDKEITDFDGVYSFEVMGNTEILVIVTDSLLATVSYATYNINYDLGDRKTSKAITDYEELFNTFELLRGESNFISEVTAIENIYGGGYGGTGDNRWVSSDMLKFGTTSVNGSFNLKLNQEVNRIIITGYVSNQRAQIKVGDSNSSDWASETSDNKTTTVVASNMSVAGKDTTDNNQATTIVIDFSSTSNLTIAAINKMPLYITQIEFIYSVDNE